MKELSNNLQENIITLLIYSDDNCTLLRNLIPQDLYEGIYYEIARRTYKFIDEYKKAPRDHIFDLFTDILDGKDLSRKELYENVFANIVEFKEHVNIDYTVKSIKNFVSEQNLKQAILKITDLLETQDDEKLDKIKSVFNAASKDQINIFDAGTRLTDLSRALRFLDTDKEKFYTGIKELDTKDLTPARKELYLFIGLAGSGKTQFMINLARQSLVRGHRVLHISCEMSEERMAERYYSNLFGITKRYESYKLSRFENDTVGNLANISTHEYLPKTFFTQDGIRKHLTGKVLDSSYDLHNLYIKEFPTGSLTINGLRAFLDTLESSGFIPDLLLVDYADIMKLPGDQNYRIALGQIYKELRGIAVERNIAVVTVSQSNRAGKKAKKIAEDNVAEDWSKVATTDTIITYNQTDAEASLGLARLYVSNTRVGEQDRFVVLVTQAYRIGQFCLDSAMLPHTYDSHLEALLGKSIDEDASEKTPTE